MAVRTIESPQITQFDRVLKLRLGLPLAKDRMTDRAVFADPFPVTAHVLVVMTAETAQRVEVAHVIAVRSPVHAHFREPRRGEDLLQRGDGAIDGGAFGRVYG